MINSDSDYESSNDSNAEKFEEIVKKYNLSKEVYSQIHENASTDKEFSLLGKQWDAQELQTRENEKRATKVYNQLAPLVTNIVNTSLKNPPAIKVTALNSSAKSKNIAKIYDGIIKSIQNESNSDTIHNRAFSDAVAGGFGAWRIIVDNNENDEPIIKEKIIIDPSCVFPDPASIEPDYSDMRFLFYKNKMLKSDFEAMYPGKEPSNVVGDLDFNSCSEEEIILGEYWEKKPDGSVCWYVINGEEIIDSSEWQEVPYPGSEIPFVILTGTVVWIDGQRTIKSIVHDSKDYQKTLNYVQSESLDYISKNGKSPYIVADNAIKPYQEIWDTITTQSPAYIPYVDGKAKPERMAPPAPPVGYIEASNRITAEIKNAVGIIDPLKDIPQTNSGKAIKLQLAQSNVATYNWHDTLNHGIKRSGKIMVDLISKLLNYPHEQGIINIDGTLDIIKIGEPYLDNGEPAYNDLSGKYAVTISTGASYADQKTETVETLLELAKINPSILQVAGDIIVRNMDFAESHEIADRLATLLPPNVQAIAGKNNSEFAQKQMLMQMQNQLQQSQQMIEKLTQALNQKNEETNMLMSKVQDKSAQDAQKAQSDLIKQASINQTKLEAEQIQAQSDENVANINAEKELMIKQLELQIEALKNTAPIVVQL